MIDIDGKQFEVREKPSYQIMDQFQRKGIGIKLAQTRENDEKYIQETANVNTWILMKMVINPKIDGEYLKEAGYEEYLLGDMLVKEITELITERQKEVKKKRDGS
jgi:hypothetical protein